MLHPAQDTSLDLPRTDVKTKYLVLAAPRCGSTMLCSALARSGRAGRPIEFFNPKALDGAGVKSAADAAGPYLADIISRRTSANGVFGMKLHFNQFASLFVRDGLQVDQAGMDFLASFDRHVFIYRHDKVLQALSFLQAMRSGMFNSKKAEDAGSSALEFDPADQQEIVGLIYRLIGEENAWRSILGVLGVKFTTVVYEELCSHTPQVVQAVFRGLGVDVPAEVPTPETVRLSNAASLKAKAAFLQSIGAIPADG